MTRDTWLWGRAAAGSADYEIRGMFAVIMGIGWLSASLSALAGLAASDEVRKSRAATLTTSVSLLVFAVALVFVAAKAILSMIFPGMGQ